MLKLLMPITTRHEWPPVSAQARELPLLCRGHVESRSGQASLHYLTSSAGLNLRGPGDDQAGAAQVVRWRGLQPLGALRSPARNDWPHSGCWEVGGASVYRRGLTGLTHPIPTSGAKSVAGIRFQGLIIDCRSRPIGEYRPCLVTMAIRIHRSSAVGNCPQLLV
jgi:hypothetical protein